MMVKQWVVKKLEGFVFDYLHRYSFIQDRVRLDRLKQRFKNQCSLHPTLATGEGFCLDISSTNAMLTVEKDVAFRNYCSLQLDQTGQMTIRENVFFNNYCSITCLGQIEIGTGCLFGEGVRIYDHNHAFGYQENGQLHVEQANFSIGKVTIGKNCWIGSNVVILNNVEIGDNVVIGAGCLIYKSIPPDSVVKHKEELIITGKGI